MKVYHLHKAGPVEHLQLSTIEKPSPAKNEVLIKVKAISINPVDVKTRRNDGVLSWLFQEQRPVILGWDIAGEIVKIGNGVEQFKVGDRVFGMLNFMAPGNAYAEYVIGKTTHLAKIPHGTSFNEAAGATLACLTALQTLRGNVKAGDKVLIHAGSGGVGHYAIQIAKHYGAHVISTSSGKNKKFLEGLGVDVHIDYTTEDFTKELVDVDFVLDGVGGENISKSVEVTKKGGKVITLPSPDISAEVEALAKTKGIDLSFYLVAANGSDMKEIAQMLEQGIIRTEVAATFLFEDIKKAHSKVETGRTVGKVILTL